MEPEDACYVGGAISDVELLEAAPSDYRELLSDQNGFVLFDGGLHVRGAVLEPDWHSLRKVWIGDLALHRLFPVLQESDVPFGQDCLGDQFVLRDGSVHKLNAEIGELKDFDMGLSEFLRSARDNPTEFLQLQPLFEFHRRGGQLQRGQLLNVYPPYCTAESKEGVSLRGIAMFDRIAFLADFAKQINRVPNGARIRIKIT